MNTTPKNSREINELSIYYSKNRKDNFLKWQEDGYRMGLAKWSFFAGESADLFSALYSDLLNITNKASGDRFLPESFDWETNFDISIGKTSKNAFFIVFTLTEDEILRCIARTFYDNKTLYGAGDIIKGIRERLERTIFTDLSVMKAENGYVKMKPILIKQIGEKLYQVFIDIDAVGVFDKNTGKIDLTPRGWGGFWEEISGLTAICRYCTYRLTKSGYNFGNIEPKEATRGMIVLHRMLTAEGVNMKIGINKNSVPIDKQIMKKALPFLFEKDSRSKKYYMIQKKVDSLRDYLNASHAFLNSTIVSKNIKLPESITHYIGAQKDPFTLYLERSST